MNLPSHIRILSRKSDLAIIQARQVGDRINQTFPDVKIQYAIKKTSGDIDLKTPLSEMPSPGVFTDDLRNDIITHKCDLAVHSWKDLPLDLGPDTIIAGTLVRADQRDILFVKKVSAEKIKTNKSITILSSSPRRIYNLGHFVKNFLPFNCDNVKFINIRGNIPSRFKKFLAGDADGLVIAKAAIDRLLVNDLPEFESTSLQMKENIQQCLWTITPLSQNPTSPGQGALGLEIRKNNQQLKTIVKTISDPLVFHCVEEERKILQRYGGGCHQKIGVSFFPTFFGLMKAAKGEMDSGDQFYTWEWSNKKHIDKKISANLLYPIKLEDHKFFKRKEIEESIEKIEGLSNHCIWVSRKSALPASANIDPSNVVWTSGIKTWKALARKGIWVNGTADGMGEDFNPNIGALAPMPWVKLTHKTSPLSSIANTITTYELEELPIKEELNTKQFFYWMSFSAFRYAISEYPLIIKANHACGPGNTYKEIKKMLEDPTKLNIYLSYEEWKSSLLNAA